jgi:hypothetical protein
LVKNIVASSAYIKFCQYCRIITCSLINCFDNTVYDQIVFFYFLQSYLPRRRNRCVGSQFDGQGCGAFEHKFSYMAVLDCGYWPHYILTWIPGLEMFALQNAWYEHFSILISPIIKIATQSDYYLAYIAFHRFGQAKFPDGGLI